MLVHRVLEHALRLCRAIKRASLATRKKKKKKRKKKQRASTAGRRRSVLRLLEGRYPSGTVATGPRHRARLRNEFRNEISAGARFNAGIK